MGYLMAESLGLVSEEIKKMKTVPPFKKPGDLSAEAEKAREKETPKQRAARLAASAKLKAQSRGNMGSGILSSRVSQSNKSGT